LLRAQRGRRTHPPQRRISISKNFCGFVVITVVCLSLFGYLALLFTSSADMQFVLVKHVSDHNAAQMTWRGDTHVDEDGVDEDEFATILRDHSAEEAGVKSFKAADENRDGRLSKVEFAIGMKHAAKVHGNWLQQKYLTESKKMMCQLGAYEPLYLDAKGNGWFEGVAMGLNAVQFVVWLLSSLGYLILCPVHTVYGILFLVAACFLAASVVMLCSAVFSAVRTLMGRRTPLFFNISVAEFFAGITAVFGTVMAFYAFCRLYVFLIPEEYVVIPKWLMTL